MKKLYFLFIACCLTVATWAYDFEVDGVYYDVLTTGETPTAAVTVKNDEANSYTGAVTIPSTVSNNGIVYGVTTIGSYAFALSNGLTAVSLPASIVVIAPWAFVSCWSLSALELPNSVDSIGDGALWGCQALTTLSIPAGVKKLGNYVFMGCTRLTDFVVAASNPSFSSDNGILFNKDGSTLVAYPAAKPAQAFTVPSSVDTIGGYAFGNCDNLTSVTLTTSITYMYGAAFCMCANLTTFYIPSSVTFLTNNPFYECPRMTTVTVDPANQYLETVDGVLFKKELTSIIYYPPAKSGSSYTIPSSVTYIRGSAFRKCTLLTSITIPSSVETIRSAAFDGCSGLTTLNVYGQIPIGITSENESSERLFTGLDTLTCVLHVPVGTKELYAAADRWKSFAHIVDDLSTRLPATPALRIKTGVENGQLTLSGLVAGDRIQVYTLQGVALVNQSAASQTITLQLPGRGIYLVSVGSARFKVVY